MQVRVLVDMVTSMMMNAYVLRRSKLRLPKTYTSFDFMANLIQQLAPEPTVSQHETGATKVHPAGKDSKGKTRKVEKPFWNSERGAAWRMDGNGHWPQDANNVYLKVSNREGKSGKPIRFELRRQCRWCNDKTVFYCTKCEAPLCLGRCFESFHTSRTINLK